MRLNVMKYSKVPISLRYQKYPGNLGMFMNRSKLYTFHKWFSNVRSVGPSLWNAPPFLNWAFKTRIPSVGLHCTDSGGSQRVTTCLGHMKKHFKGQGEHSWLPAPCGLSCVSHVQLCNPMGCSPRLFYPWDSPGNNTGVGCHFLPQCMKLKSESEVAQSCPTLSDPMDCSPPGSSVHGISQARVLEWVATAFSWLYI